MSRVIRNAMAQQKQYIVLYSMTYCLELYKQLVYFVLTFKKKKKTRYEILSIFKIQILICAWQITSLWEVQNWWFTVKFNYLALSNNSLSTSDM